MYATNHRMLVYGYEFKSPTTTQTHNNVLLYFSNAMLQRNFIGMFLVLTTSVAAKGLLILECCPDPIRMRYSLLVSCIVRLRAGLT